MDSTTSTVTIDMPGAFSDWFTGTSVAVGEDNTGYPGGPALRKAWIDARLIKRGKTGRTYRLTIPTADARAALDCLWQYADTWLDGTGDSLREAYGARDRFYVLGEIRAARTMRDRCEQALAALR